MILQWSTLFRYGPSNIAIQAKGDKIHVIYYDHYHQQCWNMVLRSSNIGTKLGGKILALWCLYYAMRIGCFRWRVAFEYDPSEIAIEGGGGCSNHVTANDPKQIHVPNGQKRTENEAIAALYVLECSVAATGLSFAQNHQRPANKHWQPVCFE